MGKLTLVRVDQRLIHGQVITSWIKDTGTDKIIILDDDITADPFMKKVFLMAGPPGCKLEIYSTEEGAKLWDSGELTKEDNVMMLFRNIPSAHKAYTQGFAFRQLQVGSAGGAPGRVSVHGPITMNSDEAAMLDELEQKGCEINFQTTPDNTPEDWKTVREKHFK